MPDTRKSYLAADRTWQERFKAGQMGQQNGIPRHTVKLDNNWSWQSHMTAERVCVNPGARDFEKKWAVSAWHLTLELGLPTDGKTYRRHALHWSYSSATDSYVCKGWKPTFGRPDMPVFPELKNLPGKVVRENNPFADMPFFNGLIEEENQAITQPQIIQILTSIRQVVSPYEQMFGTRRGIFEAPKWTRLDIR